MRIAALDQGTTSTRVLVASQDGSADIQLALRHQQHHPQSGWVEHDPLELLANLQRCLEASGRVDAIGLANQGESCMAWDARSGEPLSPLIVWQDNRTTRTSSVYAPAAPRRWSWNAAACRSMPISRPASWAGSSSTFLPLAGLSRPAACAWEPATPGFSTACAEPSPPTSPPPRAPH